jgi:hypothetical protein
VEDVVSGLRAAGIVQGSGNSFSLEKWSRDVLEDVITIEAKVSDWRRAMVQASRNQLYCHEAYIAVPMRIAEKITKSGSVQFKGIGVIGVELESATIVLKAVRSTPCIWAYYYQLAIRVASPSEDDTIATLYRFAPGAATAPRIHIRCSADPIGSEGSVPCPGRERF